MFDNNHRRREHRAHRKVNMPEKAWVQFLVLRLIHELPMHGYKLIEELDDRGYIDSRRLRSGSIYIILKRMEHRGFLSSVRVNPENRRSPRVYSITEYGKQELADGLRFVLERRKINDELIEYYKDNFKVESD